MFNSLSQIDSVFYDVEEVATSLKKSNEKKVTLKHLKWSISLI